PAASLTRRPRTHGPQKHSSSRTPATGASSPRWASGGRQLAAVGHRRTEPGREARNGCDAGLRRGRARRGGRQGGGEAPRKGGAAGRPGGRGAGGGGEGARGGRMGGSKGRWGRGAGRR